MRIICFTSLFLSVFIYFGCDQNLRPLPEKTGQVLRKPFLGQEATLKTGQVSRRPFLEQEATLVPNNSASVSGTIDINPELFTRLRGSETLYIMAKRGDSGPPVAVKRMKSLQFPINYTLTEADQMVKGQPFVGEISIVVRIDLDGNAGIPQAGDMEGNVPRAVIGNAGVDVVIDKLY